MLMKKNIQFRLTASLLAVLHYVFYNPLIRTTLTRVLS
jgi:hypothetical protein